MPRRLDLTTRRCVLRPLAERDAEALHRLWTSAGVRRYLWDDEIIPPERTAAIVRQSAESFDRHGYGLWGAWPAGGALAGFAGLWPFRDPPELELIYGVEEARWGQGFAPEIARAVVHEAQGRLGFTVVRASTDAANAASIRVLEKLGFTPVRRAVAGGLETVFFELASPSAPRRPGT